MWAQIKKNVLVNTKDGHDIRVDVVVDIVKGIVDPMATRRVCDPMASVGGNIQELGEKIEEVQDLNKKVTDNMQAAKNVKKSPVLKRVKGIQNKFMNQYEKEHKRLLPLCQKARQELYDLKATYIARRKQIYKDNAVYIAPGGCLPATPEVIAAFEALKPGEFLGVREAFPKPPPLPDEE